MSKKGLYQHVFYLQVLIAKQGLLHHLFQASKLKNTLKDLVSQSGFLEPKF